MRTDFQAILFDIDGTLVDSTPAVERTWTVLAQRHGLIPEEVISVCHGRRSEDTIADVLPDSDVAAVAAELLDLEMAEVHSVVPLPNTRELLPTIPSDRWAAVTSGPRTLMLARLENAGLPTPDVLIAAEDVTTGKPDPEGYRKAAEALGFDVRDCLVVEDAPAGIGAGRAGGATVLAVGTSHPKDALIDADATVTDLSSVTVETTPDGLHVTVRPKG